MAENSPNQLYYGDNLDVLRLHVPDESVDLVYLDPPFNSNANYNVLFAERDGTQAAAQIIWQRTIAKSLMTRQLPTNHDVILSFQRDDKPTWNADALFTAYDPENLDEKTSGKYRHVDPDGRIYRLDSLINPNHNRPNLTYEFLGVTRVWRWTNERMRRAYDSGVVVQTGPGRVPQLKRYLDEQRGRPLGDVWTDIPPINSALLKRVWVG